MTPTYTEIIFSPILPEQSDLLIASLSEQGYEGFEEREGELLAYIASSEFDAKLLDTLAGSLSAPYRISEVVATNWNANWESNFEPVTIGSFLHIRAAFHVPAGNTQYELVITPKMSFGTGHHATTQLMVTEMAKLDWPQKRVFDFGTGTGVLSILAEKMGAKEVLAIDNDLWSIANAHENSRANHCNKIQLIQSDRPPANERFDIILANINAYILKEQLPTLATLLAPGGQLLLSGLLEEDQEAIELICTERTLQLRSVERLSGWIMLRLAY
jgi:ribosomal protein L11 methyltransferase